MTARQYAELMGFEVVGRLTKKVVEEKKWSFAEGREKVIKTVFYEDEAGNTYHGSKADGWCIIPVDSADCI